MQAQLRNPDNRPLPLGWADHFDSRYVVSKSGRHTVTLSYYVTEADGGEFVGDVERSKKKKLTFFFVAFQKVLY